MTIAAKDQLTADMTSSLKQKVMDSAALQAWQSELKEFVAATHDRLHSLSETLSQVQQLSQIQRMQSSTQDNPPSAPPSEVAASPQSEADFAAEVVESVERDQPPTCESLAQITPATDASDTTDDDPMERLNAIKRRLANQMQNAS